MNEELNNRWFVMSATYGRELKIKEKLEELQIKCFIPMKTTFSKEKGKVIKKTAPVIKNLIFVYVDRSTIQRVKTKYQYLQYQTHRIDGKIIPIIVPLLQMENFISLIDVNEDKIEFIDTNDVDFKTGEKIEVIATGNLKGQIGTLVKIKGKRNRRIIVAIEGVMAIAFATLKITDVKKIN